MFLEPSTLILKNYCVVNIEQGSTNNDLRIQIPKTFGI
jgi:hypothetical protein